MLSPFQVKVGKGLRALRSARGLTLTEVASRCGTSGQTVSRYEMVRTSMLTDTLGRLLNALRANLCDLQQAMDAPEGSPLAQGEPVEPSSAMLDDNAALRLALQMMRERRGLDADRVGELIGVEPATVYTWESGKALRLMTLGRLFEVYETDFVELHGHLIAAQFYLAWKQAQPDESVRLRMAHLCVGPPAPGAVDEHAGIGQLRDTGAALYGDS